MNLIEKLKLGIKEVVEEIKYERNSIKIRFDYHLSEGNLDWNLAITQAVKNARDSIEANNDNTRIFYSCPTGFAYAGHSFAIYGPDAHTVMKAFDDFIRSAGTPPHFVSNENLDLVNMVLKNHNKKLERKYIGRSVGKYVVDK